MENSLTISKKVKQTHHIASNFTRRYIPNRNDNKCPHKYIYINIHNNIIPNNPKGKIIHQLVNGYNGTLFRNKKEYNMDETQKHCAK